MRKRVKKEKETENSILFLKTGNEPKKEETAPKKEEMDQQIENLELF